MDLALIEKLMRMLETSDLQELDVNEGGMRIRLAKKRRNDAGADEEQTGASMPSIPVPEAPDASPVRRIIAGMSGTFYRSPAPGAPPFVEEGDRIEDGRQLAIIEAMKMLNPVEADCAGRLSRILLKDGDSVAPGMVLFEIDPT
jgi:acetyl-CoA carboxylase biotin carboxyl carrier protein